MKPNAAFSPGFRISELDVAFMLAVFVVSSLIARFFEQLGIAGLFALFHFFLFCNVLRARRSLELLWAAAFVGLWSSALLWGVPSWTQAYALAFAVTVALTVAQVLQPSYHGAFWSAINSRLPQWWEKQTGRKV